MTQQTAFTLDWTTQAACIGIPVEVFFPEQGCTPHFIAEAKAICASCPVVSECLNHALTTPEPAGIWGGTTPKARERMGRPQPYQRPLKPCGTRAAYQRHLSLGETPCEPCREARRSYEKARGWAA